MAVVGEAYCVEGERELTVRKTSFFYAGDGFAAYDHVSGDLVFRVDTYGKGPALAHELVLMDPAGSSILTVRRKWPSLHRRWEGFLPDDESEPLFMVRRSSIFGGERGGVAVEVRGGAEYRVEGSFPQRCCRVVAIPADEGEEGGAAAAAVVVAEIRRKVETCAHVVLGRDVFSLCLRPRFDAAFAMGLVLVLDQITGDDDGDADDDRPVVEAAVDEGGSARTNGDADHHHA